MIYRLCLLSLSACLLGSLLTVSQVHAADTTKPAGAPATPKVVKLPGVTIDVPNKTMTLDAKFCLEDGILEWLVVVEGTKDHEAIFSIAETVKPAHIKLGLILLGISERKLPNAEESWEDFFKVCDFHKGQVAITAQWQQDGKAKVAPVHSFMLNRKTGKPAKAKPWLFTGSAEHKEEDKTVFLADMLGLIVGIWPDPAAIVQLAEKSENPYHGDGLGYEVNKGAVPKFATPVKLIFRPVPAPKVDKKPATDAK